jgi:hypothetical protein
MKENLLFWRAACFAGAITVNNAAFGEVVWRKFEIDSIAWKNPDAVAAQTSGDVGQNDVAVLELDGKRRTRKNLLDGAGYFNRSLFGRLRRLGFSGL